MFVIQFFLIDEGSRWQDVPLPKMDQSVFDIDWFDALCATAVDRSWLVDL